MACAFCPQPGSHSRRDVTGTKHVSCADHQRRLESSVIAINGWHNPRYVTWEATDPDVDAPEGFEIDYDQTELTATGYRAPLRAVS